MKPLIIVVATTGGMGSKKNNPNHPITPEEIAQSVIECWHAGASIAHLHMRDEYENGSMDVALFEKTIRLIREAGCDIIINLTTSGLLGGTFNWGEVGVFYNTFPFLMELGKRALQYGIKPEIECFDVAHIETALRLVRKGVIQEPPHFQFILGVPGGIPASIENLLFMRNKLPSHATWSAIGIGSQHLEIMLASLAMGCDVIRVGFEDNFYRSRGVMFQSNAQQVERAVQLAKLANRTIATPDEARKILHLRKSN